MTALIFNITHLYFLSVSYARRCLCWKIKLSEITPKINFRQPKKEIPYWNEYKQSELILIIFSLTTQ